MPAYPDLSQYVYNRHPDYAGALNVGWLADGKKFDQGSVPARFVDRLADLAVHHPVNRTRGWHRCPFCDVHPIRLLVDGTEQVIGDAEIRVVGSDDVTFAAPTLVVHYVDTHGYRPPGEFVDAVMTDQRLSPNP